MANLSTTCPLHAGVPATFTCTRCGTFGCQRCASPRVQGLCNACAERDGAVGELVVGETLQQSFGFLAARPNIVLAFAGAYAAFGLVMIPINRPIAMAQAEGGGTGMLKLVPLILINAVVGFLFSTVSELILMRYVGDQLEGEERPLGDTARAALERLLPAMGSNFLLSIAVALGTVLCIVPGVILAICLCLSVPAVVLGGKGAIESLSESWALTAEHRSNVFLVLLVSGLAFFGVMVVSGILQAILGRMGSVGMMLGLVVNQAFSGAGFTFVVTATIFCYMKLSGRRTLV